MPKYAKLAIHLTRKEPGEYERDCKNNNLADILFYSMTASLVGNDGHFGPRVFLRLIKLERYVTSRATIGVKMTCEVLHMFGQDMDGYNIGEFNFEFELSSRDSEYLYVPFPPEMVPVVPQALPEGVNPEYVVLVDGVYYDLCVVCKINTGIRTDYPVEQRNYHIDGFGQLCKECFCHAVD